MPTDASQPVFIIGGSRTGSTMLQVILSKSPDLSVTDELQYRSPWWLHRDFLQDVETHVGPLDSQGALDRLVDLAYSGIPVGWFWSASKELLDREILREELSNRVLSPQSILDAVLRAHARSFDKTRIGAKFPMHYSYTDKLLEWYPNCLLIHTTRNPKAVYASQANKYLKPIKGQVAKNYMRLKQFAHINIQTSLTAKLHDKLRDRPNYILVRYEDLVTEPETQIRQLCDFVGIGFQENMLKPRQFGSSFGDIGHENKGIERSSVDRWRTSISRPTAKIMDLMHSRAFRAFGYTHE
jgi:hypothetical protein